MKDIDRVSSANTNLIAANELQNQQSNAYNQQNLAYYQSKNQVEKLLGIRSDQINFWSFYNEYPVKVGSRVLRASGPTTTLALKHEKKYLARVKTIEQHQQAIKAVECFVAKQRQANKLQYLPGMDVVLNNNMWEQWEVFIENSGEEGKEWNSDTI